MERLRQRVGEDEALVKILVSTFIEQWPGMLSSLQKNLEERDEKRLERAAHTMKGAAANLEALRIRDLSIEIERLAGEGKIEEAAGVVGRLAAAFGEFSRIAGGG